MKEWYVLEWTFQGHFLKLDFIHLTIAIKVNIITIALFEKNSIYTYTDKHIWLTHQDSSTGSSMDILNTSPLCVMKNRNIKC